MFEKLNTIEKIKVVAVILLLQIISFGAGLYGGKEFLATSERENDSSEMQLQYTENSEKTPMAKGESRQTAPNLDPANCTAVKGNISGTRKTYHVPSGSFYERTTAEMCFATEGEAEAAGFIKSSR